MVQHIRAEPGSCNRVGKFGSWEEKEGRKGNWTADGWRMNDGGMMSAWLVRRWLDGGWVALWVESFGKFLHIQTLQQVVSILVSSIWPNH